MSRWCWFAALIAAAPVVATPVSQLVDTRQGTVRPAGTVTTEGDAVVITLRMGDSPLGGATIAFRDPLVTTGKERFVLEARAEESTQTYFCVSQTEFAGAEGTSCTYEPDLLFPPTWCLREVLLSDMPSGLPTAVTGLRLTFWAPYCAGEEIRFYLRRIEFQSRTEVAAELQPGPATRRPLPLTPVEPTPTDQRWVNLGPGGGGWFRDIAISPHDGTCFIGGDVGGVYRSRDRGRTWQIRNEGLANTYVNCVAFDPTDPSTIYLGTNGGPAKSTDGGDTWRMLLTGLPPLRTFAQDVPVSALLVDRTNLQRVWAGIGHERGYGALGNETEGGRVLLSEDGGEHCKVVALPLGADTRAASVLSLQQHPRSPQVLLATTPFALCRSEDRGATWTRLSVPEGYRLCFLAFHSDQPDTMLLSYLNGPGDRGGVLRSNDGGLTWSPSNQGLPADKAAWRLVADPGTPGRFYLAFNSQAGLYVTDNSGTDWRPFSPGRGTRWSWAYAHATGTGLAVDPRDPRRVMICDDIDILQTLDGGRSWESAIADKVLAATPDQPATWHGRGCEILCMGGPQAVAIDPSSPRTFFAGYWDLHTWRTDDGGQSFARVVSGTNCDFGRMGAALIDPDLPQVLWISVGRNYDRQRIYQSVNGGRSFRLVGHALSGLPPGGVFTLVIDPTSPSTGRTLYAGVTEYGVYRSTDGGLTWSDSSKGLPGDSRMIKQIALDPRNPRRLYLAAGAHYHPDTRQRVKGYLAVSEDGGENWRITKPDVEAQCLIVDPTDPRRLYAGNRNYSGVDYPNAFYYSTDAGETWTAVSQEAFAEGPGRPDGVEGWRTYVTCLAADPSRPGVLYAALANESYNVDNGRGVYVSRDYGKTWTPFPMTGLSNLRVHTLVVDPVNPQRLYAGTGGNGLFRWGPAP